MCADTMLEAHCMHRYPKLRILPTHSQEVPSLSTHYSMHTCIITIAYHLNQVSGSDQVKGQET